MLKPHNGTFEDDLARVGALVARPVESAHELAAVLRQIYHAVYDADLARYDLAQVKAAAPGLMKNVFKVRMGLRDRIADWSERRFMSLEVQRALKDVFRIARYAEDMLGEIACGHAKLAAGEKARRAFTGTDHNTLVHPKFDTGANIPFRSGDVLLVRGTGNNSAAIARIGDIDSQFSHVAMIYIDNAEKHWIVEALIEDGSVIKPLESVLEEGLARAVLFRYRDATLAARAAENIHARVLASVRGETPHIPYDFSMRLTGRRKLFCAKLIQQAFLDASGGKVVLPAFTTRFDPRNRAFFRSIGVRAKETFTPGDMDLDPGFDLVAEWRDYRLTPRLRRQDMVMTKFFAWMEEGGWAFKETFLITLVAVLGRLSSYLSNSAKELIASVVPKVPRNMKRSTIATIVMLHKSAEEVLPSLEALEESQVRMTGRPLHPRDLLAHLDRLKETSGGHIGYLKGPA